MAVSRAPGKESCFRPCFVGAGFAWRTGRSDMPRAGMVPDDDLYIFLQCHIFLFIVIYIWRCLESSNHYFLSSRSTAWLSKKKGLEASSVLVAQGHVPHCASCQTSCRSGIRRSHAKCGAAQTAHSNPQPPQRSGQCFVLLRLPSPLGVLGAKQKRCHRTEDKGGAAGHGICKVDVNWRQGCRPNQH